MATAPSLGAAQPRRRRGSRSRRRPFRQRCSRRRVRQLAVITVLHTPSSSVLVLNATGEPHGVGIDVGGGSMTVSTVELLPSSSGLLMCSGEDALAVVAACVAAEATCTPPVGSMSPWTSGGEGSGGDGWRWSLRFWPPARKRIITTARRTWCICLRSLRLSLLSVSTPRTSDEAGREEDEEAGREAGREMAAAETASAAKEGEVQVVPSTLRPHPLLRRRLG